MSTDNQIQANRQNALHSTGPRTEEGKAASSKNASKHTLTSKYLIILPGQEEAFAELESGLRAKLRPQGTLEEVLYKRIVECSWNLERCRNAEQQVLAQIGNFGIDPLASLGYDDRLDRIHRYAKDYENSLHKNMRELGKLQSETHYRLEIFPIEPEEIEDNPECIAGTPHALSQVCQITQSMKHVFTYYKFVNSQKPRNEPKQIQLLPAA